MIQHKFVLLLSATPLFNHLSDYCAKDNADNSAGDLLCANDGVCVDGIDSYSCDCKGGFTGDRCETNTDDCEEVICQYGGTCQNEINSFSCDCTDGFTGNMCETNIDDCEGEGKRILLGSLSSL